MTIPTTTRTAAERVASYVERTKQAILEPTAQFIVIVKRREGAIGVHVVHQADWYRLGYIGHTIGLFSGDSLEAFIEGTIALENDPEFYEAVAKHPTASFWTGTEIPEAIRRQIVNICCPVEWGSQLVEGDPEVCDKFMVAVIPGRSVDLTCSKVSL